MTRLEAEKLATLALLGFELFDQGSDRAPVLTLFGNSFRHGSEQITQLTVLLPMKSLKIP